MKFCDCIMRSWLFRRILRVMSPGGSRAPCTHLVVRACADTRARTHKGAGGSEGARARVDRAAQVRISGGRAHRGPGRAGVKLATKLRLPMRLTMPLALMEKSKRRYA